MEMSEGYYPARFDEEYNVLPPGQRQAEGSPLEEERRQAEGRSTVRFCDSAIPGCTVTRPYSGIRQNTSVKKISVEQTPEE